MRRRASILIAAALLSGCQVGPDYERPVVATPDAWHTRLAAGLEDGRWTPERWWMAFGDPVLAELTERATENNHDLRIALSRIREARAQAGVEFADAMPQVDATGSFRRSEMSENSREDDLPESVAGIRNMYTTGFDARWELDFFGRVARAVEAAEASYEAEIEATRDVLVSMWAEVAVNYIDARVLQRRLDIARRNAESQRSSLDLALARVDAGLAPDLDVHQARTNLATTEASIPEINIALQAALNRLAVLIGEQPGKVHELMRVERPVPLPPDSIAVGVPADLIRRRPDIRRAERDLAAQTARIGVAEAELYPQLSLSGTFEWQSVSTGDLFTPESVTYGFGPSFKWNLFDGARIRKRIEVEDERTDQALLGYEQTILRAMEEVENALVRYAEEREGRRALAVATQEAARSVELSRALYEGGLTDFQTLLDAQRTLLDLQDRLAQTEGRVSSSVVTLYKTLGGGWEAADLDLLSDAENGNGRLYGARSRMIE